MVGWEKQYIFDFATPRKKTELYASVALDRYWFKST